MEKKSEIIDKTTFLQLYENVKQNFSIIKEELSEHREVINENTVETEEAFDAINELDLKIQKIDDKIAELQMIIKGLAEHSSIKKTDYILSKYEQKVFTLLYTNEDNALTVNNIAVRLNLSELIVKSAIASLAKKGIPLLKADINGKIYFKIDHDFKEMQAKDNVLNLDHRKKMLIDKKLTSFLGNI